MFGTVLTHIIVLVAAVGAINWGLVALLNFNLVEHLAALVSLPELAKIVYIVVGAAGVLTLLHALREIL